MYRTRENDQVETTPGTMYRVRFNNSTGITTTGNIAYQNGPFTYGRKEVMNDVVTPRYRERSAKGEVIINPMQKTQWERLMTPGGFAFHNGGSGSQDFTDTYEGYYAIDRKGGPNGHLPVPLAVGELQTLAGTEAAAAVEEPSFEGLVFLGELRETLNYLKNPIKGYADWVRWMRKVKLKRHPARHRYRTFDFIADNWLSYRYGVRPLVYDAQDFMKALNDVGKAQPKRKTARGTASDYGYASADYLADAYAANVQVSTSTTRDVKVRAGILYETSRSLDVFGTSFTEIPAAAWELIPFSFVADWFANIGTYLRAITPKVGVRQLGSWTVTEDDTYTKTSSYVESLDDVTDEILNPGHCTEDFRTKVKTRAPGVNVGLTFKSSQFNLAKLDIRKIDDSLALARKILKSFR